MATKIQWRTQSVAIVMFALGLWLFISSRHIVREWVRSSDDFISTILPWLVTFFIAGLGLIFMGAGILISVAGFMDGQ